METQLIKLNVTIWTTIFFFSFFRFRVWWDIISTFQVPQLSQCLLRSHHFSCRQKEKHWLDQKKKKEIKKIHIELEVQNIYLMDSVTRSLPASVTGNQALKSIRQPSPQLHVLWPAQERWGTFPERQTTYPLSPPLMSASVCPGCSPDSQPGEVLLTHLTRHIQWGIRGPFFSLPLCSTACQPRPSRRSSRTSSRSEQPECTEATSQEEVKGRASVKTSVRRFASLPRRERHTQQVQDVFIQKNDWLNVGSKRVFTCRSQELTAASNLTPEQQNIFTTITSPNNTGWNE